MLADAVDIGFTNESPLRALACGSLVVETCTGY